MEELPSIGIFLVNLLSNNHRSDKEGGIVATIAKEIFSQVKNEQQEKGDLDESDECII